MVIKREVYTDYEIEFAMRDKEDFEKSLHALMDIIGATIESVEATAGEGSKSMGFNAGKKLGVRVGNMLGKMENIESAIDALSKTMGDSWKIQVWKPVKEEELVKETDSGYECKLLFRDCMIRQTLEREGIPQKGALCYLTNGYVVGALETMLGLKGDIEFIHSGNNACLKELKLTRGGV